MADVSGTLDEGQQATEPAEDASRSEDVGQLAGGFDAVLKGDDEGALADERADGLRGVRDLPRLDGDEDDVDRAHLGRIVGDPGGMNDEVAVYAAHPQPVLPDRGQMPPPGDELHVLPGLRQSATEVPANGAGSEDCDSKIAH